MSDTNSPPHTDGWRRTQEQLPPPGQMVLLSDGVDLRAGTWDGEDWRVGPWLQKHHRADAWPYWRFAPPLPQPLPTEGA